MASSDRVFLKLSDEWALATDNIQWILCKWHRTGKGLGRWDGVSFVRSTKAILERCIREKGAVVDAPARQALDAMPDTFDAWLANSLAA